MARQLKCQWCSGKAERDEMVKVTKGKVNKYYHMHECYDEYIAEIEFKKKESIVRDSLYTKIMEIYGVRALPSSYYMQIEGLRHGNRVFKTQSMGKRYREGYEYDLIEDAYKESEGAIEWSLKNKAFTNLTNALNYGLSIVINNIYEVEKKRDSVQQREHLEQISENNRTDIEEEEVFESSYKKKETDDDDFFDMLD